jgi:hypothetical protein
MMLEFETYKDRGFTGYVFGCPKNGQIYNKNAFSMSSMAWYGAIPEYQMYFNSGGLKKRSETALYKVKLVATYIKEQSSLIAHWIFNDGGDKVTDTVKSGSYNWFGVGEDSPLLLAASGFKGTIKQCKVYDRVVIEDEINEFLGV